jgi:hypothetical protein
MEAFDFPQAWRHQGCVAANMLFQCFLAKQIFMVGVILYNGLCIETHTLLMESQFMLFDWPI